LFTTIVESLTILCEAQLNKNTLAARIDSNNFIFSSYKYIKNNLRITVSQ